MIIRDVAVWIIALAIALCVWWLAYVFLVWIS